MITIIHAKNIDKEVRLAMYGMLEWSAMKLFPTIMKNVSVKLHLKRYNYDGEAMVEEGCEGKNPRNFKIVIDPYRLSIDDWGRELNYSEWVSAILKTIGHEMVHVKQYIRNELSFKKGKMCWMKKRVDFKTNEDYYSSPQEVEAYGKELWLYLGYNDAWNRIKESEKKT
jgi:hypothetical protein